MKLSLMNFHELTVNCIKTYQVHNNSATFMKFSHELSWTSYELNCSQQVHKNSWLFMKCSIWNLWTKSWTTFKSSIIFMICHELFLMNLINHWWMFLNVHVVNVHHLINFITLGDYECIKIAKEGWFNIVSKNCFSKHQIKSILSNMMINHNF